MWCGVAGSCATPATTLPPPSSPSRSGGNAGRRRAGSSRGDGESGKRYGNQTIGITACGEVGIKLPAPLAGLANAKYGRYVLAARVAFPHRGAQWADRVEANRAVAYRIHLDVERARWYVDASWRFPITQTIAMDAALAHGVIGVDTNADHLAAWPPGGWTPTATRSGSHAASSTTCPAPPSTATLKSATPCRGC
jgi:hypothetical protein